MTGVLEGGGAPGAGVFLRTTAGAVDVELPATMALLAPPSPNPARVVTPLRLQLPAPAAVRITVHDVRGRLVHGWEGALPEGPRVIEWDLRDDGARPVPAGRYFVRVRAGALEARAAVLVVR